MGVCSHPWIPPRSATVECFLSDGELVCHSCYIYCKHILETENCMSSSEEIVKELRKKQKHLEHGISEPTSECGDSHSEAALKKTALYICKMILNDRAVLFPGVYAKFCQFLPSPGDSISKARVLTYIGNEFGNLLSSICCHKKWAGFFPIPNLTHIHYCHMLLGQILVLMKAISSLKVLIPVHTLIT